MCPAEEVGDELAIARLICGIADGVRRAGVFVSWPHPSAATTTNLRSASSRAHRGDHMPAKDYDFAPPHVGDWRRLRSVSSCDVIDGLCSNARRV